MKRNVQVTVFKTGENISPVRTNRDLSIKNINYAYLGASSATLQSVTSAGTTATATTLYPHGLATNDTVTIRGASVTNHNQENVSITVTGPLTFTYTISSTTGTSYNGVLYETVVEYLEEGAKPVSYAITGSLTAFNTSLQSGSAIYVTRTDSTSRPNYVLLADKVLEAYAVNNAEDLYSITITRSSTTATATTSVAHNLTTGDYVTVAGASQSQYNGTVQITVVNNTSFTYTVSGSPTTPATGTITAQKTYTRIYYGKLAFKPETIHTQEVFTDVNEQLGLGTSTASGNSVTINAYNGVVTSGSLTTAAGAEQTLTITNRFASSTSNILVSLLEYSGTDVTNGVPVLTTVTRSSGSFTVKVYNAGAQPLAGTVSVCFSIQ